LDKITTQRSGGLIALDRLSQLDEHWMGVIGDVEGHPMPPTVKLKLKGRASTQARVVPELMKLSL